MEKGSLRVYRASAGSGKTFRLTVEYIKLLLENRIPVYQLGEDASLPLNVLLTK